MGRKCGRVLPSFAELRRRKGCRLLRWTWGRLRMLGGIIMRCLADWQVTNACFIGTNTKIKVI